MITDPIADMLTQIRNALAVNKQEVVLSYSGLKEQLANLLKSNGWLESVEVLNPEVTSLSSGEKITKKFLKLVLQYHPSGRATILGLKRVSKPGQRIYVKVSDIPRFHLGTAGITIISTSRGLMTDREARQAKVGGEVICQIW